MANEKDFGGFYNLKWDIWPSLTVAQVIHIFQGNSKFKSSVFLSDNGILCPDIVIKTLLLRKIKVRMEMSFAKSVLVNHSIIPQWPLWYCAICLGTKRGILN